MSGAAAAKPSCRVCGRTTALRRAIVVRPAVASLFQQEVKHWDEGGWICLEDLQRFQHGYVEHLLSRQWERLVEIQEVQMELINRIGRRKP